MRLSHRHPGLWNPRFVPYGQVEVDWSHPLAAGLAACFVPGNQAGPIDFSGTGPALVPDSNGDFPLTPEGYGYDSSTLSSSAWASIIPLKWTCQSGGTIYWRGSAVMQATYSTGFHPQVFGLSYGGAADGSSSPVWGLSLAINNAFTGQHPAFYYYPKGASGQENVTLPSLDWTTVMAGAGPVAFGATFVPGGNVSIYVWPGGSAPVTQTSPWLGTTSPIDSTLPWQMGLGVSSALDGVDASGTVTTSAYLWDRVLSPAEMALVNASPFAMLRPVRRVQRVPIVLPPPAGPYRRWNRTYLIR